jgi:hypothetical protein
VSKGKRKTESKYVREKKLRGDKAKEREMGRRRGNKRERK